MLMKFEVFPMFTASTKSDFHYLMEVDLIT